MTTPGAPLSALSAASRAPMPVLKPGQVWVSRNPTTRTRNRRIIAVLSAKDNSKTNICYCAGHKATRWCCRPAFLRWIRRYNAVATRPWRQRALTLTQDRPTRKSSRATCGRGRARHDGGKTTQEEATR